MAEVRLEYISKRFLDVTAVHDLSLTIGDGEFVVEEQDTQTDAVEVLVVAEPYARGVVGRRGELDVDRVPARARTEVLVDDVAVVLAGADHARGEVVRA